LSGTTPETYAVWSTDDFNAWKLENPAPGIANRGDIVAFNGNLYIYNMDLMTDGSGNPIKRKSYRSSNGKDWSEMTVSPPPVASDSVILHWDTSARTDSGRYTLYQTKGRIIPFHSCLYAVADVMINRGSLGQETQCIIVSKDGSTWNFVGPAPVGDYRFSYELFTFNNNLYFMSFPGGLRYGEIGYQYNKVYVSADGGTSWERVALWDNDNVVNPDNISFIKGTDSVLCALYTENPGQSVKESFLVNGTWNQIPSAVIEKQQVTILGYTYSSGGYDRELSCWLAGNRFYWIDPTYTVKSIKLF
jgi:hypothetical protein